MKKFLFSTSCVVILLLAPKLVRSQPACNITIANTLSAGNAATNLVPPPILDHIHVNSTLAPLVCFPAGPALRLSTYDGKFGQLSLIQTANMNSTFAQVGDVLLRSGPTANDLVFTIQNPCKSIRFVTMPCWGIMQETERVTITSMGQVGIGNNSPEALLHLSEPYEDTPPTVTHKGNLMFAAGLYANISSNKHYTQVGGVGPYENRRINDGCASQISFDPGTTNNPDGWGGMSLSAQKWASAGTPLDDGNNVVLTYRHFQIEQTNAEVYDPLYNTNTRGVLFSVTAPKTNSSSDAVTGWTYIKNRTLIGTQGVNSGAPNWTYSGNIIESQLTQPLMLGVNGAILCKELLVKLTSPWSDFVFEKDYNLMPLHQVEQFIADNKHLPGIPSAAEVERDGVLVTQMQAKLLQKIEELTLYTIQLEKRLKQLEQR